MSHLTITIITLTALLSAACSRTEITRGTPDQGQAVTQDDAAASTGPALSEAECGDIRRIHEFDGIYLASQPSPADFAAAKEMGIRTVVNQRHDGEVSDFAEEDIVTGLGMTYLHLSFSGPDELTDDVLDQTIAAFRDAPKPMLVHCGSANRTGATWLAYAMLERGLSWDEAMAEARLVGLRSAHYEEPVRQYVERKKAAATGDE